MTMKDEDKDMQSLSMEEAKKGRNKDEDNKTNKKMKGK